MVTMDKTACCYAAVAAVLSVTTSPESARVPPAGLATTANTVSQMRIHSTGYTVSQGLNCKRKKQLCLFLVYYSFLIYFC